MASEADCGVSTVLEALHVASKVGFLVPGECRQRATRSPTRREREDFQVWRRLG
jgi:hypothetical protein